MTDRDELDDTGPERAISARGDQVLFTASQAAEILSVSRSTLYLLLAEGLIESVKIGSLRRVPRVAIDRYVERLRSEQATRPFVGSRQSNAQEGRR